MQAAIPVQDTHVTPIAAARRLSLVVYTLYALSFFSGGLTGLAAIMINHIKYRDVSKTLYGSHFRWQMRTFWLTVIWWAALAGASLAVGLGSGQGHGSYTFWGIAIAATIANPLWVIYRLIRGSLACIDGRRMPV